MEQSHCGYCGHRFETEEGWPRTCSKCRQTTWMNPLPAAVALVPVYRGLGTPEGVLCILRGNHPGKGQLALPGGFIETGETWREALSRELFEETGVRVDPEKVLLESVEDGMRRDRVMIFGKTPTIYRRDLSGFKVNNEVLEIVVITEPRRLAFPSHTDVVEGFFYDIP